jgi:multicomponent Na+:H+ antiporter subunit D
MTLLTLIWLTLPFLGGFLIYLLPRLDRIVALLGALFSLGYATQLFLLQQPLSLRLLDHFGVSLQLDTLTAFFVLTNGLVTLAVVIYCWQTPRTAVFYAQMLMLHGSVNAAFACTDLISLYVALEVLSIAAFLLIAYPRTDSSIWVGLRYLLVSNVAMLFYLIGAVLVYKAHHSFDYQGLTEAPPEAAALILMALLVKGGIFISGWWLPLTHAESAAPVSALMSGVVVKAAVLPLVRFALLLGEIEPLVRLVGVGTALLGVVYAVFEKDSKRILAFHTISQMGFILAAPEVGGFYALTHGLVKSALFLQVGNLPSRNLKELQHQPMPRSLWLALALASFSISGFPLLSGFGAKVLTMKNLLPWQVVGMNVAAFGTSISFAKFIFLPHRSQTDDAPSSLGQGFWWAMVLLLGGLVGANLVYYEAYRWENVVKPLATIALGWLAYYLWGRHLQIRLPRLLERLDHLLGVMTLTLIVLFWGALA